MSNPSISADLARSSDNHRPVWMVEGAPIERGRETPTYGPFRSLGDAQGFADGPYERYVYDAAAQRSITEGTER